MTVLLQDLRYAFRALRKSPLFAIVAVVSLALGIGANTAIFSLVHQLMLELLPIQYPEQLVLLQAKGEHYGSNTGSNAISYPMYRDFRDKNPVFNGMFCKYGMRLSLTTEARTELVSAELVSGNYFPVLGVRAALGRVFTASDDLIQGGHPLVVLSYGYWTTRLVGAWGLTRLIEAQLFGIHSSDPMTMILACAAIAAVAGLAGYVPARRATAIDPMRALRFE